MILLRLRPGLLSLLLVAGLGGPAAAQQAPVSGAPQPGLEGGPSVPMQLVARQHTTLSAELPAQIDAIAVKDGESFKAGQSLVVFDCTIQRAQVDEARAVLTAAVKARDVHRRLKELGSAGELELDKAASDAAVAQAKLNSAQAVLSKCAIAAPFSGRVVERKAQPHQYVQAGQALLEILDDSALEAEFIVPSAWVTRLKVGQEVHLRIDETGQEHAATVIRLGAKVDAVSHSLKVIAGLKGASSQVMAGMTGTARLGGMP